MAEARSKWKVGSLRRLCGQIKNRGLREKVLELVVEPPQLELGLSRKYTPLDVSPASKRLHHSYPGGLIEHTVAVTRLGLAICDILEEIYQAKPDRDVVIASLILHDLFKFYTYEISPRGRYFTSSVGEHIDHLSLVTAEIYRRKFPASIIHAVLASHGENGPMRPRTLEALVVHLADRTDAELNGQILDAAKYLVAVCVDPYLQEEAVRVISAFDIVLAKQRGGCEAVRELVDSKLKTKPG